MGKAIYTARALATDGRLRVDAQKKSGSNIIALDNPFLDDPMLIDPALVVVPGDRSRNQHQRQGALLFWPRLTARQSDTGEAGQATRTGIRPRP